MQASGPSARQHIPSIFRKRLRGIGGQARESERVLIETRKAVQLSKVGEDFEVLGFPVPDSQFRFRVPSFSRTLERWEPEQRTENRRTENREQGALETNPPSEPNDPAGQDRRHVVRVVGVLACDPAQHGVRVREVEHLDHRHDPQVAELHDLVHADVELREVLVALPYLPYPPYLPYLPNPPYLPHLTIPLN
jgi:hypothetical protein